MKRVVFVVSALTWELPQSVLALVVFLWLKLTGRKLVRIYGNTPGVVAFRVLSWGRGVSLGRFVYISDHFLTHKVVMHEYGHSLQSRILGPLYLFVVGLPSITQNILGIVLSKGFKRDGYAKRYYQRFPEDWADKLGGVKR